MPLKRQASLFLTSSLSKLRLLRLSYCHHLVIRTMTNNPLHSDVMCLPTFFMNKFLICVNIQVYFFLEVLDCLILVKESLQMQLGTLLLSNVLTLLLRHRSAALNVQILLLYLAFFSLCGGSCGYDMYVLISYSTP